MICEVILVGLEQEKCNTPMNVLEVGALIDNEMKIEYICPRCGGTDSLREFVPPREE